ncbi:hypothetical protein [Helicobacter kayseriensis]|uniref:hypothetical protein n=1 Tax=Helicobacter kayseriensis TaxID=2905877 RepID=UPI001E415E54|nr:hypothetical protein [Helicobacter kayseriensis]MCE3047058.1 hypothetical protein [Helicobacter kayseriensis]MCE3048282.1 hypothetical protein [Helicobacter kayseriensis]
MPSNGFVLLEAVVCLVFVGFALSLFGSYVSYPKLPLANQELIYPTKILSQNSLLLESSGLVFEVTHQMLQEKGEIFFSFKIKQ